MRNAPTALLAGGICALGLISASNAETPPADGNPDRAGPPGHRVHVQAPDETPNFGRLRFDGGFDVTHAYFFRGLLEEDRGVIVQPFANMYFEIYDEGDLSITPHIGTWNSFHSRKTGTAGTNSQWYESDLYGGVNVGLGDWSFDVIYTFYTFPNGAAGTVEEIGFVVGFDDGDLMSRAGVPFSLNPWVGVYYETAGSSNAYLELGIEPEYALDLAGTEIDLGLPVVFGASLDDYYLDRDGDETFAGYLSVGLTASTPLPIPATDYGEWRLNAGVQWLYLFAHSARDANRGDTNEVIGTLGISFSY